MDKILSIIISNRNDLEMLSVTVNSCIEGLRPIGLDQCEIIICDNSDENIYKLLDSCLPTGYKNEKILKIVRQPFPCLFTARETAIENATGEYIVCLDSHMLVGHNMLFDLVNFMADHEDDETLGFAHAPLRWAHHHERRSVHDRDMSVNELGDWNRHYDEVRTITWKGMPWICRRKWFLDRDKGLNGYGALRDYKVSWGGGDMHIGIKPWLLGFKNWAVPTSAAIHIGPFPNINQKNSSSVDCSGSKGGYRYRLYSASGDYPHTFGFLVSCFVLGGEEMMNRNKDILSKRFGKYIDVNKYWAVAKGIGKGERAWLDERKKCSFQELLTKEPWNG